MIEFKLPDIGEGIAEGEIVKWLVAEGDVVAEHQPIVEVMTDKATVEVPAPAPGRITKLLAGAGDTVPVGDVIFHLDSDAKGGAKSGGNAEAGKAGAAKASKEDGARKPAAAEKPRGSNGAGAKEGAKEKDRGAEQRDAKEASRASAKSEPRRAPASKGGGGKLIEFKLPDIGEGIAEGEIVKWLVEVGAEVAEHDPVVEVMTDKATVEVPAPAAGTIAKQLAAAGDTVPVGSVIFHLQTGGGAPADAAEPEAAGARKERAPERAGDEDEGADEGEEAESEDAGSATPRRSRDKVVAVPSARRVARELGVDLGAVEGSGRHGIVRRADVERHAASGAKKPAARDERAAPARGKEAAAPAAAARPEPAARPARPTAPVPTLAEELRTPYRGIRRKIGEAMTRSKQTAAHFTVVEEIDVTELVAVRAKAKEHGKEFGVNVTYMPFIMKAAANGLTRFRTLNGHLDEAAGEIVLPNEIHIGVATDTPNGLVVPVVRNVESKGMLQLAAELQDVAQRTREGKVRPEELRGSTFTITNAGNIGGTLATPIINFPDIAILGVHRIVKRPGVVETPEGDEIAIRHYMNLSCSVDHRLADGADAARFLAYLRTILEDPGLLTL